MNLEFEPGTFITLKRTNDHARHIIVNNNNVYKTNVYYEYYDNELDLYNRMHYLIVNYNYVLENVRSSQNAIVLTNPNNKDYVKIFIDNNTDGSKFFDLYIIEMDKMQ
jgi:hypothetical protein